MPPTPAPENRPASGRPRSADSAALVPAPALPERQPAPLARAGAWVGWHALELTTIGLPLLAAAFINGWLALAAAPAALLWASQELRTRHRTAADGTTAAAEEGERA